MGTSNKYGSPKSNNPLVPSWLEDPTGDNNNGPNKNGDQNSDQPYQPLPNPGESNRFTSFRRNFNNYIRYGDRNSLKKALSEYVKSGTGGKQKATKRMSSSIKSAARIYEFIQDIQNYSTQQALNNLGLNDLIGKPANTVLTSLTEIFCPLGGPIDDSIARNAWEESILKIAEEGFTDISLLSLDQWQAVLIDFMTKSIELRIYNDIGPQGINLPKDIQAINQIQNDLDNLIQGAVNDALHNQLILKQAIPQTEIQTIIKDIYTKAFGFLETLEEE